MNMKLKVYTGYVIICLLWGSSWAAVKLGLEEVPLFFSLSMRFAVASGILGIIAWIKHLTIPKEYEFWRLVIILCATSFTVPFALIYAGQLQVDSGLSSILFATFPLWVAVLSHYILPNEKMTVWRTMGLILGFLGVIIIFNNNFMVISFSGFVGMGSIILGAIVQALGLVTLRKYGEKYHPVTLNLWPMLLSTFPLFIVSLITEDYSTVRFESTTIGTIVYLAIFCTVVTFVIYFWLIKYVEAVILSLSAFLTPVIAVLIAIILLQETMKVTIYVGSIVVLLGVAVANVGDVMDLIRKKRSMT